MPARARGGRRGRQSTPARGQRQGGDQAGVDAAAYEYPDGNIAHQHFFNAPVKELLKPIQHYFVWQCGKLTVIILIDIL